MPSWPAAPAGAGSFASRTDGQRPERRRLSVGRERHDGWRNDAEQAEQADRIVERPAGHRDQQTAGEQGAGDPRPAGRREEGQGGDQRADPRHRATGEEGVDQDAVARLRRRRQRGEQSDRDQSEAEADEAAIQRGRAADAEDGGAEAEQEQGGRDREAAGASTLDADRAAARADRGADGEKDGAPDHEEASDEPVAHVVSPWKSLDVEVSRDGRGP